MQAMARVVSTKQNTPFSWALCKPGMHRLEARAGSPRHGTCTVPLHSQRSERMASETTCAPLSRSRRRARGGGRQCCLAMILWSSVAGAADHTIGLGVSTVDGGTFCGASACTAADTIIIEGGTRGRLILQNLNGNGSYITIKNDASGTRSTLTGSTNEAATLLINNCRYIDLRGDGDPHNHTYGINVVNVHSSGAVKVHGQSDHIGIGYLEVEQTGTELSQSGITVNDSNLSSAWTYDTFEIHHNYVHDVSYAGMYLGHNKPAADNNPYLANFSIHHNLLEDLGSYGFTFKGVKAGSTHNSIHNNIIRASNRTSGSSTGLIMDESQCTAHNKPYFGCSGVGTGDVSAFKMGFGISWFYGTSSVDIHDNWVEKTKGPGIKLVQSHVNVHANTILGCGTQDSNRWGQGIYVQEWNSTETGSPTMQIYDNVVVEPTRYGFSDSGGNAPTALLQRNIVVEAGLGELENIGGFLTEGIGANANVYDADANNICFATWTDDGDYSNDVFHLTCPYPYTGSGEHQDGGLQDVGGLDSARQDAGQPDLGQPDGAQPDVGQSHDAQPDGASSEGELSGGCSLSPRTTLGALTLLLVLFVLPSWCRRRREEATKQ